MAGILLAMLIKARLEGHDFDLMTLAELFREGDPAVARDEEGFYLSFTVPDGFLDHAGPLYEAASLLLRQVKGVARVLDTDFRSVGLSGRFSDEAGRQHTIALAETAEARVRALAAVVTTDGGQPSAPPAPGPDYVHLAKRHSDVAEVLEILGKASSAPGWFELYKALEIVCKDVSGASTLSKGLPHLKRKGWVPSARIEAFTMSANHQAVSGDQARHARMEGNPSPKKMMTLIEAQQMISGLVTAWMDWLRSSPSRP